VRHGKLVPGKPWLDGMPRTIFVSDMGDALSQDVPFEYLVDEVIRVASSDRGRRHLWLWLTKLPRRMAEFAGWLTDRGIGWPENLWAGTSLTSRKVLGRVEDLLEVPARVRFLSVEPQWQEIGPDLPGGIGWVIQGGESRQRGRECHPFDLAWARSLRDQCQATRVPYFLKQLGSHVIEHGNRIRFLHDHAGDWSEWPADLRVRQMPRLDGR
jgi:protein gp37